MSYRNYRKPCVRCRVKWAQTPLPIPLCRACEMVARPQLLKDRETERLQRRQDRIEIAQGLRAQGLEYLEQQALEEQQRLAGAPEARPTRVIREVGMKEPIEFEIMWNGTGE